MSTSTRWEQLQRVIRVIHNRRVRVYYSDREPQQGTSKSTVYQSLIITDADSQLTVLNKQLLFRLITQGTDPTDSILALPEDYGLKPGRNRPLLCLIYREKLGQKWGRSTYSTSIFHPHRSALVRLFDQGHILKRRGSGHYFATRSLKDGSRLKAFGSTESGAREYLDYQETLVDRAFMVTTAKTITGEHPGIDTKTLHARKAEYYRHGKANNAKPDLSRYWD